MTENESHEVASLEPGEGTEVATSASEGLKSAIYQAISVQRPVVLEYLRSLRRDKPDASVAEILAELEKRYVTTVTVTSTGVGASAAIPGVGVPLALGLGAADLLFFYETSALYVLAATELHGIEVSDAERAQPLVFGMLLGEKSQSQVSRIVFQAAGAGGLDEARKRATATVGKALPAGWGEVLTEHMPESALAPLSTVLAREALKASAKFGAGTLGKAIPFGVGAVVGGVGSFTFGRDVVKAARIAFPMTPSTFPASLQDFERVDPASIEPSRAQRALTAARDNASDASVAMWDRASEVVDVFRSVDLDGDGVPDEARAVTAAKRAGSAVKGVATGGAGVLRARLGRRREAAPDEEDV